MTYPSLVFDPIYSQLPLPKQHRFPIEKYQGIHDALVHRGIPPSRFVRPEKITVAALNSVFDPSYVDKLIDGQLDRKAMRRIGFEWSQHLIARSLTAVGGTVLTARLAIENGRALNLTGGYHHAFADFGSGFCLFNDLYLAAKEMLSHDHIDSVLIIDCDVHQGDGTAMLASQDDDIYTVSLHGEKNFPHRKQQSDIDLGFDKGTKDDEYLTYLESTLSLAFSCSRPDAVIYDAGVDVHENDDLGHLLISTNGVYTRDKMVIDRCEREGVPVACVIGGGYQRDIPALVDAHLQLFIAAGVDNLKT